MNAESCPPAKLRPNWNLIRQTYLTSAEGLRPLARIFGVSFSTLSKRAVREGWAGQRKNLGDETDTLLATQAKQVATTMGQKLGMSAAEFAARCVADTEKWFARIEALASEGKLDPMRLRTLIQSWRDTVTVGRLSHGLDNNANGIHCQVNIMSQEPVRIADAEGPVVDTSPAELPPMPNGNAA